MKLKDRLQNQQKIVRLCRLPYPGEVLVKEGQQVEPETIVAKTELISGTPAFFDISRDLHLSGDDFQAALRVKLYEMVEKDQVLVETKSDKILAPFKGWVEYISISNGNLLIRQKVSENEPPLIIEASSELGVRPKAIKRLALVKKGKQVVRLQSVAGDISFVYTPMAGTVGEISTEEGTIEIIPQYDPTILKAGLYGIVKESLPQQGAAVETTATTLQGAFAAGQEQHGYLSYWNGKAKTLQSLKTPAIVFIDTSLTLQQLKQAEQAGVKGIIAASMNAQDMISYYGDSIAQGITGKEDKACSVMLLQGFGSETMPQEFLEWFQQQADRAVSLQTATRLLPPLEYPRLVLYSEQV